MPAKFKSQSKTNNTLSLVSDTERTSAQIDNDNSLGNLKKNITYFRSRLFLNNLFRFKKTNWFYKRKSPVLKSIEIQTNIEPTEKENSKEQELEQLNANNKKFSDDLEKLHRELENANATINKLRKNENKLREK